MGNIEEIKNSSELSMLCKAMDNSDKDLTGLLSVYTGVESLRATLEPLLKTGDISTKTLTFSNLALDAHLNRVGLESSVFKDNLDSAKDFLLKIWKAIKKAFQQGLEVIVEFVERLFSTANMLEGTANEYLGTIVKYKQAEYKVDPRAILKIPGLDTLQVDRNISANLIKDNVQKISEVIETGKDLSKAFSAQLRANTETVTSNYEQLKAVDATLETVDELSRVTTRTTSLDDLPGDKVFELEGNLPNGRIKVTKKLKYKKLKKNTLPILDLDYCEDLVKDIIKVLPKLSELNILVTDMGPVEKEYVDILDRVLEDARNKDALREVIWNDMAVSVKFLGSMSCVSFLRYCFRVLQVTLVVVRESLKLYKPLATV